MLGRDYQMGQSVISDIPSTGQRLATLEIGRGIAALFVALYHMNGLCLKYFGSIPFGFAFAGGHAGVEFFFVLSGFIIYYVHRLDIGKAGAFAAFCRKRAIRVIPMYWIVISLMLATFVLIPRFGAEKQLDGVKILMDYFLIPRTGGLILPPAWTLQREFLFYWIFGLAILAPRLGFSVFLAWQCLVLVMNSLFLASGNATPILWFFFGVHNFGFLVGAGVAWLMLNRTALSARSRQMLIATGLLGVVAVLFWEWHSTVGLVGGVLSLRTDRPTLAEDIPRSAIYSILLAMTIYGCASWERSRGPRIPRYLTIFGASSYVLYLIHEPLGSLLTKLLTVDRIAPHMTANSAYLTIMVIVVLTSMTIHLAVETRITRYLRAKLPPVRAKATPLRRRDHAPLEDSEKRPEPEIRLARASGSAEGAAAPTTDGDAPAAAGSHARPEPDLATPASTGRPT